jgi:hypothetical protein
MHLLWITRNASDAASAQKCAPSEFFTWSQTLQLRKATTPEKRPSPYDDKQQSAVQIARQ